MKILSYVCSILMLIGLTAMAQDGNSPPEVTNVSAQQVGQQVEITYDLLDRDGDLMTVSLLVSSDGGSNFDLEAKSLEGEVGEGIANGQGKKIVWQVAVDIPDLYGTNFVFEVVADDNVGPRAELVLPTDGASMALIPAGSFEMGDHLDGMSNALPVHTVELDAFYMDVHEVTVGQFKQFVNQSGYNYNRWNDVAQYSPGDDYPMVYVNWNDATAYANWVGKRLPTEAEWEYAARGGLEGQRYPWGNELTHDNANYTGTGGIDQWDKCSPVGSFAANGYGLYDVAGNVLEWCADWYAENYYSNLPVNNPLGPDSSPQGWRVLRGGGWDNSGNSLRMAYRHGNDPSARYNYRFRGFRCVLGLVNSVRFTSLPLEAAQSPATLLEMTSGKTELPASSNSSTTVTVRLYNQDDIPIKGDMVNLTVDKGTIQSPAIDNGDGSYTATYTADNSAGTAKITALTNSGQFATATINLLEIGLSLSAPANQIDVGTTTQLNLTLQDSKGRAVAGESVQLTADQGIVQLTDNGDGTYQAQYTAAEIGGSVTITANSSGGLSQSIKLQVLDVSKDQSSIKAVGKIALQTGEDGQVEVTVIGPSGQPVSGRQVRLTADPSDKFAVKSSTLTDASGVATVTFTAGKPGARILKASVNGLELAASVAFMFTGEEIDRLKWMEMNADKKWEKDGSLMVLIPVGSFEMGDHLDGRSDAPVHRVELDAFYMDTHEVTVGQFRDFVNQSGYNYGGWESVAKYSPGDAYPMVSLSWNDATAYAEWVGKRLPTEAEWEYAARGGLAGKRYPWGDEITHNDANYNGTDGRDNWAFSAPVGSFEANGYGLYDMVGNVSEWCMDWYGEDYYSNSTAKNPLGPSMGHYRVVRGGNWNSDIHHLRLCSRYYYIRHHPGIRAREYGFRCVLGSD